MADRESLRSRVPWRCQRRLPGQQRHPQRCEELLEPSWLRRRRSLAYEAVGRAQVAGATSPWGVFSFCRILLARSIPGTCCCTYLLPLYMNICLVLEQGTLTKISLRKSGVKTVLMRLIPT